MFRQHPYLGEQVKKHWLIECDGTVLFLQRDDGFIGELKEGFVKAPFGEMTKEELKVLNKVLFLHFARYLGTIKLQSIVSAIRRQLAWDEARSLLIARTCLSKIVYRMRELGYEVSRIDRETVDQKG